MANIQIGKYKRPGIYIEEYDKSVIASPTFEGISNLVIGSSKKGGFNTLIKLASIRDLENIYGPLDRQLERKGSYFHRTVSKMLEIAPVYTMNLLLTDDNLDKAEYRSLSTASGYLNDIKREAPYRRYFDTTGFWKRDTESFVNITKPNTGYEERAFSLTNLSDRPISVFAFKSQRTGFDRTLLEWYGSQEKMPPYVNTRDYASDYLIDVVVVGGDWSNYKELSVDPRWSQYFSPQGIRKDQVSNFANDRNITLLSYYEAVSLIPYFRDLNGQNIFIESVINRDTDSTGLFCGFNKDLVEDDFYNGLLDLLGNTLVDKSDKEIDFLSYKENISEYVNIKNNILDLPGNLTYIGNNSQLTQTYDINNHSYHGIGIEDKNGYSLTYLDLQNTNRTNLFMEGMVYNLAFSAIVDTMDVNGSPISADISYMNTNPGQITYAVINNRLINLDDTITSLVKHVDLTRYPLPENGGTVLYTIASVLNSQGDIEIIENWLDNISGNNSPMVDIDDIVLTQIDIEITENGPGSEMYNTVITTTGISIGSSGYNDLSGLVTMSKTDDTTLNVSFVATNNQPRVNNYAQYREFKLFNRIVNLLSSPNKNRMSMLLNTDLITSIASPYEKFSMSNVSIANIETRSNRDKSFDLIFTNLPDQYDINDLIAIGLNLYTVDNEVILGDEGVVTKNEIATSNEGVVGRYSNLYSEFFDGNINTGDYFYQNRLNLDSTGGPNPHFPITVDVEFWNGEDLPGDGNGTYDGYDYVIFESINAPFTSVGLTQTDHLLIPESINGVFNITYNDADNLPYSQALQLAQNLFNDNMITDKYAYQINKNVINEKLTNINTIYWYNEDERVYIAPYTLENGDMILDFKNETLEFPKVLNALDTYQSINIKSDIGNMKQTVEIVEVIEPNKILVDGTRYTEIKIGDFLEAYYDIDSLDGEYPRKLTRILQKRRSANNPDLMELMTDAEIKISSFSGDLQTMRFVPIDEYISTYKTLTFKGFKVRKNSLPDGTETRQNDILNLVAKGTPLFKALTNKEALEFRYLIDSFGLGLIERSKQQLMDITGNRLDSFAFLNMPSLRSFKNSSSPTFVDKEGVLQTSFIAQGGDPQSNPAFLYSFGEGLGTTTAGYFTPYITVNDNGRPTDVPPSAWVATTYMRKHTSNITSIVPWTIAAGVTNGKITNIVGLEMDFTSEDIENLNVAMMNPIVYKRNRGHVIETENTAQVLYKSSLSYIHVREVLIELEKELSRMLLDYQWKYNTPDVRAEIKLRADVICEQYVNKNGLYNFFNKIDEENNTSEIIDNQMGILDTFVEPIMGMGIIINNITILSTGAISVGGFINS